MNSVYAVVVRVVQKGKGYTFKKYYVKNSMNQIKSSQEIVFTDPLTQEVINANCKMEGYAPKVYHYHENHLPLIVQQSVLVKHGENHKLLAEVLLEKCLNKFKKSMQERENKRMISRKIEV